jgi:hypothetical protein
MRRRSLLVLSVLFLFTVSVFGACWNTPKCPTHDTGTVRFANKQKTEDGHTYFLYHCSAGRDGGHDFWVKCDY